jgi:hypothetical protein
MRFAGIDMSGEDLNLLNISDTIASWIISISLHEKKFLKLKVIYCLAIG